MAKPGRPRKIVKYTKSICIRFTQAQWLKILTAAEKEHLEPSVFIRKVTLDHLPTNLKDSQK